MKKTEYTFEERTNITITAINCQLIRDKAPFMVTQIESKFMPLFTLEANEVETQYAYMSFTATDAFIVYVTKEARKQHLEVHFSIDGKSFWFEEATK